MDEHAYALRYLSSYREDFEKTYDYIMQYEDFLINKVPKLLEEEEKWL